MGQLTHKKHGLDKENLKHFYCEDFLSDAEIGKKYSLTDAGVGYLRKKYNIKTINAEERISGRAKKSGLRDILNITKDQLEKMYLDLGMNKMAKMFGCSKILIKRKLLDSKIQLIDKKTRQRGKLPEEFTIEQKQILFGSLLGDGCIRINEKSDSARFSEGHCDLQRGYLEWKQGILLPFSKPIKRERKTLDDGRVALGYSFRTHFHPLFVEFYKMFYDENGIKHYPDCFVDLINPLSLAVWYLDDGGLSVGKSNKNGSYLISSSFSRESLEEIVEILNDKYDLNAECRERELNAIMIGNKDGFFNLIKNYIHDSMVYKISLNHRFSLPSISKSNLVDLKFDLYEWHKMSENERESHISDLVDYWHVFGFPCLDWYNKKNRMSDIESVKMSEFKLSDKIDVGYTQGNSYCLSNFPEFWKVKRYGKQSPWEVFWNKNKLCKVINDCIKYKNNVSASILRSELRTFGGVVNFRPVVAKSLYDKYCPVGGRILDPCAGWGGRLLGFYCSDAGEYVGIDACSDTIKGLKHMKTILDRTEDKKVSLNYAMFEKFNLGCDEFDMVFTSPPYWKKELYFGELQSHKQYKSYEEWVGNFLYKLLDKSIKCLKNEGVFVLNVADIIIDNKKYTIEQDVLNYMDGKMQFEHVYKMINKNFYSNKERCEPIFVWKNKI